LYREAAMSFSWVNESQISDTIHIQQSVWWYVCVQSESRNFLRKGVQHESNRYSRKFSHDGRWVAYLSNASGRYEVYARPFPGPGAERQISSAGGLNPVWSANNTELYYLALDGTLMAASLSFVNGALEPGRVQPLFGTRMYGGADPNVGRNFDVASDGRFLINYVLDNAVPITLIQNWRKHVPGHVQ
jgi:hypothetical protein